MSYEELVRDAAQYGTYPDEHPNDGIKFCESKLKEFGKSIEQFTEDVNIHRLVYITGP